uniref:Endonuclease/exonuclease/phosphatase domain-containing protein n=1 Tax=Schizaphis graminum TaxID=13262 RepID=A0A2S2NWX7_SCHGA
MLALQETHIPDGETRRLKIPGFRLIDYIGHPKHGLATYVNHKVEDRLVNHVTGNEHTVAIRLDNLIIYNVYKPPSTNWSHYMLPTPQCPTVYVGDFNSHSTNWGYTTENEDEERLCNWATLNRLHLLYDAKQGGTFVSGRWGTAKLLTFVL